MSKFTQYAVFFQYAVYFNGVLAVINAFVFLTTHDQYYGTLCLINVASAFLCSLGARK